ncbi:hypothetical protein DFP72DRAFT_878912 [Ephemerocybe angulata]|uniref:RING-type domain-containing protein n=1 Tax=Ephemerocybe angulata TaxID=980116 RepID=A0A8H6MDX3_9AGAR|nr:hypothetical protein DFP72DRAFT_878912 [Tulosesus angulatus]
MLESSSSIHDSTASGKRKGLKKQQSESFGGGVRRRAPTESSSNPRPTTEFGWQLALQGLALDSQGYPIEKRLPSVPTQKHSKGSSSVDNNASAQRASPPPPYLPLPSDKAALINDSALPEEPKPSEVDPELLKLSRRYADKEFGWQLGLQCLNLPHILPSKEERSPTTIDTNPYSGAVLGSREGPGHSPDSDALPSPPSLNQDLFQQIYLDEAAKVYSGFQTNETSPSPLQYPPLPAPSPDRPKEFLNNPFKAILLQAGGPLIDLDDDGPFPSTSRSQSFARHSSPKREEEPKFELLDCHYCPRKVGVTEISQIPSCLHVVCHSCLVIHVEGSLSDGHFPVRCPMCILCDESEGAKESENRGTITMEIIQQLPLSHSSFTLFQEFQISLLTSRVYCPKCQETMLVDRKQYLDQATITCPREQCGNRWCKSCLKSVPIGTGSNPKHKCKPDKKIGVRSCPDCGSEGRRVANDNYIQCRGVGCHLHYCFKCGVKIAQGSLAADEIVKKVQTHYQSCTRFTKGDKCKVQ